jgi:hypothetical protein
MSESSDSNSAQKSVVENAEVINLDANYSLVDAMDTVKPGNIISYDKYYHVHKVITPEISENFTENVKIYLGINYKVNKVHLLVGEIVDKPYFLKSTFKSKSPKQYGAVVCVQTKKEVGKKLDFIINVTEPFDNVDEIPGNYKWKEHPSTRLYYNTFGRKGGKKTKTKKTKKSKKTKHLRKSKRK